MSEIHLHTLLGEYPVTAALHEGSVSSESVTLDIADVAKPATAFKRVVRDLEFDVAELAITTFLLGRAAGKPYVLLPATVLARLQHGFLVHDVSRGRLTPSDLEGRRIGVRSYSVTTGMWIRSILAEDFGVDTKAITWVTFEEAHVAEFVDPSNVVRAPAQATLLDMLKAGEIDAAIVGDGKPDDPDIQPVLADIETAERRWRERTGTAQVNHLVVARREIPEPVRNEVTRMLGDSIRAGGSPADYHFGVEAHRRALEVAIDCVYRQGMIPVRYEVDELFV